MAVESEAHEEDHAAACELELRPGLVVGTEETELENLLRLPPLAQGVFAAGLAEELALDELVERGLDDQHLRCLGLRGVHEHVAHLPELEDDRLGLLGVVGEVATGIVLPVEPEEARDLVDPSAFLQDLLDGVGIPQVGKVDALAEDLADVLQGEREVGDELRRLVLLLVAPGLRIADGAEYAKLLHVSGEVAVEVGAGLGPEGGTGSAGAGAERAGEVVHSFVFRVCGSALGERALPGMFSGS